MFSKFRDEQFSITLRILDPSNGKGEGNLYEAVVVFWCFGPQNDASFEGPMDPSCLANFGLVKMVSARLRLWRWTKAKDPDPRWGAEMCWVGGALEEEMDHLELTGFLDKQNA